MRINSFLWFKPVEFNIKDAELLGFSFDNKKPLNIYFDSPFKYRYFVQISKHGDFILIPEAEEKKYFVLKRIKYMHELDELSKLLNLKKL